MTKKVEACRVCGGKRIKKMPYCPVHAMEYKRRIARAMYKRDYTKKNDEAILLANREL